MITLDQVPAGVAMQVRAQNGNRRRRRRQPVWRYPHAVEQKYRAALLNYVDRIGEIIRDTIYPNLQSVILSRSIITGLDRVDDYSDEIDRLMEATTLSINRIPFNKAEVAREIGYDVNTVNSREWGKQLKAGLGVDVFRREEYIPSTVNSFVKENVSLITKMENDLLAQVDEIVQRSVRQGDTAPRIARQIEERIGVSKSRAKLIARDQTGKLNGQLTRLRQEDIGVESYVWRSSDDERVRSTHASKDDRKFQWDQPPSGTGHPGQDYQCRCYAEPDFTPIIEGTEVIEPPAPLPQPTPTPTPRRRRAPAPRTEPVVGEFVQAKTVKEAEEWARANNLADVIDYKNLDIEAINVLNERLFETSKNYPKVRGIFEFVGSFDGYKKHLFDNNIEWLLKHNIELNKGKNVTVAQIERSVKTYLRKEIRKLHKPGVMAFATDIDTRAGALRKAAGLVINNLNSNAQGIKARVALGKASGGFSKTAGGREIRHVIDHELGHNIDHAYNIRESEEFNKVYASLSAEDIQKGVGKYALENKAEFLAEAYTEYINSDSPRKLARTVGKIVEEKKTK